jgi:fructose-bisphosphate aldolase class II
MLAKPKPLLDAARADGYAIGAFNTYNLEITRAIIRAAERQSAPVIVQTGVSAFEYAGLSPLARLALGMAEAASVPVVVHLDHARELDVITDCLGHGYRSVMFDGSKLPFEENVEQTRAAVEIAHGQGAIVEGELGAMAGAEDSSGQLDGAETPPYTDPDQAAEFVGATGVDVLAVAIGNVHGYYKGVPKLDFERLDAIRQRVSVPLALHGASGLPNEAIRRAIGLGITKINVNTDLRKVLFDALRARLSTPDAGYNLPALMTPAVAMVQAVVEAKIVLFGGADRA